MYDIVLYNNNNNAFKYTLKLLSFVDKLYGEFKYMYRKELIQSSLILSASSAEKTLFVLKFAKNHIIV